MSVYVHNQIMPFTAEHLFFQYFGRTGKHKELLIAFIAGWFLNRCIECLVSCHGANLSKVQFAQAIDDILGLLEGVRCE